MFGPHEVWLSLGAMAFYLADSFVLLYADQLLVEQTAGSWWPRRGSAMLLAGRRPFLPNPFAPQRPLLTFSLEQLLGSQPAQDDELRPLLEAIGPLRVLVLVLLVLFGSMPVLLYVAGTGAAFLCWLGCVYAVVLLMAGVLWRRRRALGISPGTAAKLGFECIVCSPLAINLVRRVTLRAPTPDLEGARRLMDADAFDRLTDATFQMLEERLLELTPGEAAMLQLNGYRQRLEAGAPR